MFPDLVTRPGGERIEFDHFVSVVPFDKSRVGTESGLVAANGGDPGIVVGKKLSLRDHLADETTGVWVTLPQFVTMTKRLLRQRNPGVDALETNPKPTDQFVAQFIRVREQQIRI